MDRMTIKNPNVNTYRAPLDKVHTFRLEQYGISAAFYGELVDKLGQYEDTGLTPVEIKKMMGSITENEQKKNDDSPAKM